MKIPQLKNQKITLTTLFVGVGNPKFLKDIFKQAPFGDRRLQKVGPYKSSEPQPIDIHIYGQQQTDQNEGSCHASNDSVSHNLILNGSLNGKLHSPYGVGGLTFPIEFFQ